MNDQASNENSNTGKRAMPGVLWGVIGLNALAAAIFASHAAETARGGSLLWLFAAFHGVLAGGLLLRREEARVVVQGLAALGVLGAVAQLTCTITNGGGVLVSLAAAALNGVVLWAVAREDVARWTARPTTTSLTDQPALRLRRPKQTRPSAHE